MSMETKIIYGVHEMEWIYKDLYFVVISVKQCLKYTLF